jgi:glycosyltransferase involved in cell wall biosynthesis
MKPFFSIITVTKNTEKKIDITIRSVLSQNFKNFEYIIVDGYSEDNTFAKLIKYKNNKKIKIFKRRDKNFYDGLNYAIRKAKGDYISILNSGDIFFSKEILKNIQSDILKYKNFNFYFSNLIYYDKNKEVKRIWKNGKLKNNLSDAFKIAHPTIFLINKIAKKFKYNDNYRISADLDFILRLIKNNITYKHLNFFSVVMEAKGMSSSFNCCIIKLIEDIKIHKFFFKNYIFNFFKQKLEKLKSLSFFSRKKLSKIIKKNTYNLLIS